MNSKIALVFFLAPFFISCTHKPDPATAKMPVAYDAAVQETFDRELPPSLELLSDQDPVTIPADWKTSIKSFKSTQAAETWGNVIIIAVATGQKRETLIPHTLQEAEITLDQKPKGGRKVKFEYTKFIFPERTDSGMATKDLSRLFKSHAITYESDADGKMKNLKGLEALFASVHKETSDRNLDEVVKMAFSEQNLKQVVDNDIHKAIYGKQYKPKDVIPNHLVAEQATHDGKYIFQGWTRGGSGKLALFTYEGTIVVPQGMSKNNPMPTRARILFDPKTNRVTKIINITYMSFSMVNDVGQDGKKVEMSVNQQMFMKMDYTGL